MGKQIISQRRGRGTTTFRAHSFRHIAPVLHRPYDSIEKNSAIKGQIMDLLKCSGHSAPLAKIKYSNGETSYIFAFSNLKVNDFIESGFNAPPKSGNTLPLRNIPEGTLIYNIENLPGDGGKFCRASGTFSRILAMRGTEVLIELPSKKQRMFSANCRATIGVIAGAGRLDKPIVKAGKEHHIMRAKGKVYPRTAAVAMNAVDHPFGSGRGRKKSKKKPVGPHAPPGSKVGPVQSRRTGKKN